MRKSFGFVTLLALVAWCGSAAAMCSGGGMGGGGGMSGGGMGFGGGSGYPTVAWSASYDQARSTASSKNEPFAVLFCSASTASFTGEGTTKVLESRRDAGLRNVKLTAFDREPLLKEMKKAGINTYVKVDDSQAHAELWKKFGATANQIVICAPDGAKVSEVNSVASAQSEIIDVLKQVKAHFEALEAASKKTATASFSSVKSNN